MQFPLSGFGSRSQVCMRLKGFRNSWFWVCGVDLEGSKLSEGPIFCLSNFGLGAVCVRCAKPHALGRVERRKPPASLLPVLSERWSEGRRDAHGHGSPGH